MVVDPTIVAVWHAKHVLMREALSWLSTHGDPGDEHPIATGVAWLREHESPDAPVVQPDPGPPWTLS